MAEKIQMIALSPTMEEGTIAKWTKKEGDKIVAGDVICEVETDKATMDYECSQEGILLKILLPEGKQARVGDMIGIIGKAGEDFQALLAATSMPAPAKPVSAAAAEASPPASLANTTTADSHAPTSMNQSGKASPLARKIASDKGLDISQIPGSGPDGRVVKRDVESFTPGSKPQHGAGASAVQSIIAGQDQRIPVSGKRAIIAKRLAESLFTAPHFFLTKSVQMDNLMAARTMLNKEVPANAKVSFNAFLIKFAAEALKRNPGVNASWQGDSILQFASIDIGLAVDLGNGLITPIVKNAGNKGVLQIDQELKVLIEKAGSGQLKPEEYSGATFTISNLGSFGVEEFTAIINPPGSAILALGEVKKTPVVLDDNSIVVRSVMKMTISCDHRVIDGALGGRFIAELGRMIENPVRVLF